MSFDHVSASELEFWRVSPPVLGIDALATALEGDGWDGLTVGDSQCISPETYVVMTKAALSTTSLRLSTWVTNPVTRHAAVAASALATLQCESGNRIEVGIGRGDSALAYIGLAPAPLPLFERYVRTLRAYLNGEDVPLEQGGEPGVRDVEELEMGIRPGASRLKWLPDSYRPVPVVVASSGPKVMGIATRTADKVSAIVGPSIDRLTWARDTILASVDERRIPPAPPVLGASCVVAVNDDRAVARRMVRPVVTVQARFAAMHSKVNGPASDSLTEDLQRLRRSYDMNRHAAAGSIQSTAISDEVIDNFAIAGPAGYVADRLLEIAELGYRRFTISVEAPDTDPELMRESQASIARDVLPRVRAGLR